MTNKDEYGLKAGGLLHSLEKFSTLFGLELSHLLFSASEQVSLTLQTKNIALHDALSAVDAAKKFFKRTRSDETFDKFYDNLVSTARKHSIDEPELPRQKQCPVHYENSSNTHTPVSYYRKIFFEACDVLHGELEQCYSSQHITSIIAIEKILINAANGLELQAEYKENFKHSCYKDDVDITTLETHLKLLPDVIKQGIPFIEEVTSVATVCDAMNTNNLYKQMLPTVHNLIRLYYTIPVSSTTAERAFSALKRILTKTRSTMTEVRLNNCFLLHTHKELTNSLNLEDIAKEFINNDQWIKYFGNCFN